ncbi:HAMP domain-containing protein [Mycetohabitans rhizoxinica]|uniref:ATP-binding protein n=1 Tax=Mycetohabitans rhizoxinica TaxID=412963 RepID=UPI0030CBFD06
MRRPFDSLFGRLALLVVGVLLLAHFAWFALIRLQRSEWQARYAVEETMFLIEAVRQHVERTPEQPLPSRVKVVPDTPGVASPADPPVPPPVEHFLSELEDRLPPGTQIRAKGGNKPSSLWVLEPGFKRWIVVPLQPLRSPRRPLDRTLMWLGLIFTGAVLSALFAAWQLQRPLRTLAQAVARFGRGLPVAPVRERGPLELRQLTRGFNTMVSNLAQTDKDRNVMLAGVAHDLRTPLARLRLRAEMLDDVKARDGVVRDVDSMTHIVDQFLVFAHDGTDRSEPVGVDQQCDRIARTYRAVSPSAHAVRTDLRAGPDFVLPAATLERVLSNLLDNAHAYGAPPVVIETVRTARGFTLTVSDQGGGISPQDLLNASRPFVRLDPARGGNGHSGLGLAIVERLTNRLGGECRLGNHECGGLRVELAFPAQSGTAQA